MKDKITTLLEYIRFRFSSGNEHGLHSPFVYDLYTRAIRAKHNRPVYNEIEGLRKFLLCSNDTIEVTDFGAGSKINNKSTRRIKDIVRYAEKSPQLAQALYRVVEYLEPGIILDLGTSLGLTTLYLAAANKKSTVYTFEGCPATAALARMHFEKFYYSHIKQVEGNIDFTLEQQIALLDKVDFVFFDANHRYEPTMNYFRSCLTKAHEHSVFVFDDIYWSEEMQQAWKDIKQHEEVTLTIDLFYYGLVFFRKKQPKQHFRLRI